MNTTTIKLYDQDSYLRSFKGTVLTCEELPDSLYHVTLDRTGFFPEGGGQPCDLGLLGGIKVVHVNEEDSVIFHTLVSPLPVGDVVTGVIDWARRFDLMQHHSAEHIVSGLVNKYFGYNNVGFHMGKDAITIDFNGSLTEVDLRKIELEANLAVYENIPIEARYPTNEELVDLDYRSKKELSGNIRIVSIAGYDSCACCAPHVSFTGAIGSIKLTSFEKYKSGVRITMICGQRALNDYNNKERIVTNISVLLSSQIDKVLDFVGDLKDENATLKAQILDLKYELLRNKTLSLPKDTDSISLFDSTIEPSLLRPYCNLLVDQYSGICGVFTGSDETSYKYILASKSTDVRPLGKKLNQEFAGKGGGTAEMVQGSIKGQKKSIKILFRQFV